MVHILLHTQTERQTDRQTQRHRDTETPRHRHTETNTHTHTHTPAKAEQQPEGTQIFPNRNAHTISQLVRIRSLTLSRPQSVAMDKQSVHIRTLRVKNDLKKGPGFPDSMHKTCLETPMPTYKTHLEGPTCGKTSSTSERL